MQEKLKRSQGITLIALIITIIVLLILARNSNKFINKQWIIRKSRESRIINTNKRNRRSSKFSIYSKTNRRIYKRRSSNNRRSDK